jgi:hypothetical protein
MTEPEVPKLYLDSRKAANLVSVNVTPEDTIRIADAVSDVWRNHTLDLIMVYYQREMKTREERERLRELLRQACESYSGKYGEELGREGLDNILTIIAPKLLETP